MVNIFDKLYSSINDRYVVLSKFRFYSAIRFMVRLIANVILPIYFWVTQGNKNYNLNYTTKTEDKVIVSLTSFPVRIGRLWLVIETILRQTLKPEKIILW